MKESSKKSIVPGTILKISDVQLRNVISELECEDDCEGGADYIHLGDTEEEVRS